MTRELANDALALFPGQGAISSGAGEPWRRTSEWSLVSDVSDATGVDVVQLLLNTPDAELVRTDRAVSYTHLTLPTNREV